MSVLRRMRGALSKECKRIWDEHPEPTFVFLMLVAITPYFTYQYWKQWGVTNNCVSLYKSNYVVWRPDDPHVKFMRPPNDYPGEWMSKRDNFRYKVNDSEEY